MGEMNWELKPNEYNAKRGVPGGAKPDLSDGGPTAHPQKLEPPRHYMGDSFKLSVWHRFSTMLFDAGVTDELDHFALEELCETWCHVRLLENELLIHGHCDEFGKRTGASGALADYKKILQTQLKSFGLVPQSRGKVYVPRTELTKALVAQSQPKPEDAQEGSWGDFKIVAGG
jgi:phage terminase small subunit